MRRRWRTLLALALFAGVIGGVATGAVAAARRGRTTVDRLEQRYRNPDVTVYSFAADPAAQEAALRKLITDAGLTDYRLISSSTIMTLDARHTTGGIGDGGLLALVDIASAGRAPAASSIVEGRAPTTADEIALSQDALDAAGARVGGDVDISWYRYADLERRLGGGGGGDTGGKSSLPRHRGRAQPERADHRCPRRLGTIFEINKNVALLAPAFWADAGPDIATYGLGIGADVTDDQRAALEAATTAAADSMGVDPSGGSLLVGLEPVRSAINLESIAIFAFAAILAIAAALFLGTATARAAAPAPSDMPILSAIGVDARDRAAAAALVGLAVGLPAAVLTLAIAISVSSVAPFGFAASAEVERGVDIDAPVIALGVLGALLLGVVAASLGAASGRRATSASPRRSSRWPIGPPLGGTVGLRLLSQTAHGRAGTALRAAAATAVAGTVAVVAAWTFAGSMAHLVDTPALQGWTWTFEVGNYSRPESVAAGAAALAADPDVAKVSGFGYGQLLIDGRPVEVGGIEPVTGSDLDPEGVQPPCSRAAPPPGPMRSPSGPGPFGPSASGSATPWRSPSRQTRRRNRSRSSA